MSHERFALSSMAVFVKTTPPDERVGSHVRQCLRVSQLLSQLAGMTTAGDTDSCVY